MKKTILLSFLLLLAFTFAACGDKGEVTADAGAEKDALDGDFTAFAPEGEVYAVIDGEEFIYDPIYLSFHDYVSYPDDPATLLPDIMFQYYKDWSYGDYALFRELLCRDAHASGFSFSEERSAELKKAYEDEICGGLKELYETNHLGNEAQSSESKAAMDSYDEIMNRFFVMIETSKEKYGVKDDKALADLTWPVHKEGYYGSCYSVQYRTENLGDDMSDSEAEQELWQNFYEELQAKYHCTPANE